MNEVVDALYAFIVVANGIETVPSIVVPAWDDIPYPVVVPLILASLAKAHALRHAVLTELVHHNPALAGLHVKLVRYDRADVVDELNLPTTQPTL